MNDDVDILEMPFATNGNCRYDVVFYEIEDCAISPPVITSTEFTDPDVIWQKQTFIPVADDDRIVYTDAVESFTINTSARMAANVASFPNVTPFCFAVKVTPLNSILYTPTITKTYDFIFHYCDPIFPALDDE